MKKIILLDLNKTLAKKIDMNYETFQYNVKADVYSQELVAYLNRKREEGFEIHLITARPDKYKNETLNKIKNETCLIIDKAIFKNVSNRMIPIHDVKRDYLRYLLSKGVLIDNIEAVESNFKTRSNYKREGLKKCRTRDQVLKEEGGQKSLAFLP